MGFRPVVLWWVVGKGAAVDAPDDGGQYSMEGGSHLVVDLVAQMAFTVGYLTQEGIGGVSGRSTVRGGSQRVDGKLQERTTGEVVIGNVLVSIRVTGLGVDHDEVIVGGQVYAVDRTTEAQGSTVREGNDEGVGASEALFGGDRAAGEPSPEGRVADEEVIQLGSQPGADGRPEAGVSRFSPCLGVVALLGQEHPGMGTLVGGPRVTGPGEGSIVEAFGY